MLARLYEGGYFKPQAPYDLPRRNHARTLRKARENIKQMVNTGTSFRRTRSYLHHFTVWWSNTVESWGYEEILIALINTCFEVAPAAAVAAGLLQRRDATLWSTGGSVLTEQLAA